MNAPIILKPTVRTAGPADEQKICELLLLANAENAIMEHSNERVLWYVRRFLNGHLIHPDDPGPRGVFGVIGPVGGSLEAIVMLGIGQFWYAAEKHLEEYMVFVHPDCRRGGLRHGIALIEWCKEQSRKTGLVLLTGILSNHRTEAKCRLYRRHMPKIGEYFFFAGDDKPRFFSDQVTGPGSLVVSSSKAA